MSNNGGSFTPLAAPVTVVGTPKAIPGHVVQASSSKVNFGGGDHIYVGESNHPNVAAHPKDKYKWHTVVDGFSKLINYLFARTWYLQ